VKAARHLVVETLLHAKDVTIDALRLQIERSNEQRTLRELEQLEDAEMQPEK